MERPWKYWALLSTLDLLSFKVEIADTGLILVGSNI